MLYLCLLMLLGAVHYVHALEEDTQIDEHVARYDEGGKAYPNRVNFLALKGIELANSKQQTQDVEDNNAITSGGKSRKSKNRKITDDVYWEDGAETLDEINQQMNEDWQKLFKNRDIDGIVNKYTDDAIHMYRINGETHIVTGRENFKKTFDKWINQDGYSSIKVNPIAEGRLGSEFFYTLDKEIIFDKNQNKIRSFTILEIFKHIMHDNGQGGWAVQMVSEIQD